MLWQIFGKNFDNDKVISNTDFFTIHFIHTFLFLMLGN